MNAYEASLTKLVKIREQIGDPSEEIERIDEIIMDALYPKNLGLEFEKPDFSKVIFPNLTNKEAAQFKKNKHTFIFEVPANIESSVNGKKFIMPITKQAAEQSLYDVVNLLNLNAKVNLNGRTLSSNDIEKILNKINEMKDEFEYQD